jgi:tRNA G10  N-methylase Trm11
MNQSVLILGRQPALGLAELESLYGADKLQPAGSNAVILDIDPDKVDFKRLGGSIKLSALLHRFETTDWSKLEQQLRKTVSQHLQYFPEGKFKLGLSAYGFPVSAAKINASALSLKKIIRNDGRSVRVVPNKEPALNSAQILHNGLTTPTGWELVLIRDGATTLLARTVQEQDIDAYAARDQGRPKRDARVGMLPPKLAQTIVNLAVGDRQPSGVLDPFCGTGVVLQEALLMGYEVHGSDIEPRMIDYSRKNMEWLRETTGYTGELASLEAGDATAHEWTAGIDTVACEGYLGQPFNTLPSPEKLEQVRSGCSLILKKFLQNIGPQLPAGARLCLAVPAWQQKPGRFLHLPTLDHLDDMGYNRLSFKHVRNEDLIYARADQIVARELLVLVKR